MPGAYPKEIKTLGDRIRRRRLELGLLQKQIAEQIGVTEATIYNWEGNRTCPAIRHIPAILRFLGYVPFTGDSLPERLVLFRKVRGLSRKKLAKLLSVDETTLADWENGKHRPTKRSLQIVEALFRNMAD